jgi:hypothetical protein
VSSSQPRPAENVYESCTRTALPMSMDEAVTFALANVDPKLLTGPIANIIR